MSPASQLKRKSNAQSERTNLIRKVERSNETDVILNDEQHEEMCGIVDEIDEESLEKIFLEASEHGVGSLMKDIWFTDSNRQQKDFFMIKAIMASNAVVYLCMHCMHLLILGVHGNGWNMITIRIGTQT